MDWANKQKDLPWQRVSQTISCLWEYSKGDFQPKFPRTRGPVNRKPKAIKNPPENIVRLANYFERKEIYDLRLTAFMWMA